MPLNGSPAGHVVVTPHGQTVQGVGSGPADVADTSGPVTTVSSTRYTPSPSKGGIAGYTGFIPGSQYVVGTNYRRVADTCLTDLERRSQDRRDRLDRERTARVQDVGAGADLLDNASAPTPVPAVGQGDAKYSRYTSQQYVQEDVIPIPGYGGFIPKARSSSMGVGKRFSRFADEGFHALHDQVNKYRQSVPA
ncbi:uncharacterized protein LOC119099126 isoform X2 [Pollicipes pollicipes]|uniref:uncharacterized protein LOC119099126 isoform X2 n=1 Tax=Pollicipes pollicipes TaxID=41117 RepID=UPI001884DF6C|nr:uncharacterized protein LOC119099126 isoform X2 [Pollicipes pollicipes]